MQRILNRSEIDWAWKMRIEGHPFHRIADALYCNPRTVERALRYVYGQTTPAVAPLKYPGDDWERKENTEC